MWIQAKESVGNESFWRLVSKWVTRRGVSLYRGSRNGQTQELAWRNTAEWDSLLFPFQSVHSPSPHSGSVSVLHTSLVMTFSVGRRGPTHPYPQQLLTQFPATRLSPWDPSSMLPENCLRWKSNPLTPWHPAEFRTKSKPLSIQIRSLKIGPLSLRHTLLSPFLQPHWATRS